MASRIFYNDVSTILNSDDVNILGLMAAMTTASHAWVRGKALTLCAAWHHLVEHLQGLHLGIQGPLLVCSSGFGGDRCLV
jgi:hypothetical protein